jgi:hypothetical protein
LPFASYQTRAGEALDHPGDRAGGLRAVVDDDDL